MAEAYMTSAIENPLCDRLKTKFSGRGLSHVGAPAYDPKVKIYTPGKVERTVREAVNPFEETAIYTTAGEATRKFEAIDVKQEAKAKAKAAEALSKEEIARMRLAAYEKKTPFVTGAYATAYARAAGIRVAVVDYGVREQKRKAQRKEKVTEKSSLSFASIKRVFSRDFWHDVDKRGGERVVKLPKMSKSLIVGIVVAVVILFVLIYSFSQITAIKNEITTLEDTKETLNADIEDLQLQIDLKNDVRVLEDKAEDIGMVKSSKVDSKYVTLATDEHIEVVDDNTSGTEENYGIFSTMMSSVSANWDNLVDYFS